MSFTVAIPRSSFCEWFLHLLLASEVLNPTTFHFGLKIILYDLHFNDRVFRFLGLQRMFKADGYFPSEGWNREAHRCTPEVQYI